MRWPVVAVALLLRTGGDAVAPASVRPSAAPDSLATLTAGIGGTCVTTTSGAGYCWGNFGRVAGTVYRIVGADGKPTALHSLSQGWFNRCGLSADDDVACDWSLSGPTPTADGKAPSVPRGCAYYLCAVPLGNRGPLPLAPLRSVTTGSDHACALAFNGTAYCWGHNHMGQLGLGYWTPDSGGSTGAVSPIPAAVPELRFSQISAGEMLTCGVTVRDGEVYCWGYGQSGTTGDSTATTYCDGRLPYSNKPCSSAAPHRVLPESLPGTWSSRSVRFSSVHAGMRLACGISTTFEAYCWGGNYRCALGRCHTADSPRAHLIGVPGRVVEIGAGYWFACARTADARVFCWGDNRGGELGSLVTMNAGPDGGPPDYVGRGGDPYADPCFLGGRCSPVPVQVWPGRRWLALTVGPNHACALAEDDGGIYCWGGSDRALLGMGMQPVPCDNRAPDWSKGPCQPNPVRVPGLPELGPPPGQAAILAMAARPFGERVVPAVMATRLLVSQREVRALFPAETARAWGWAARSKTEFTPGYEWGVSIDAPRARAVLSLTTPRSDSSREFSSASEVIASGGMRACPGMDLRCAVSGNAVVENQSVILTWRDTALIARLFAMRPAWFHAYRRRPDGSDEIPSDSIRVEYGDPQIPEPDSLTRAGAAQARLAYQASINWISRRIDRTDAPWWSNEMWLEVGDSAQFRVSGARCSYDFCFGSSIVLDSGWTVLDTTVAQAHSLPARPTNANRLIVERSPAVTLVGLRPGRTRLRVTGLHGASDSIPTNRPPPRSLEQAIVVTVPVDRVRMSPRPEVIRLDDTMKVVARVFDRNGKEIAGAPVAISLREAGGENTQIWEPFRRRFTKPGKKTLIATFGRHADTLTVIVVDPRSP